MTATVEQHRTSAAGPRSRWAAVAWACAGAAVLVQMAFPFTAGGTLALTTASVLLLASAALAHAGAVGGVRVAATLLLVAGGGGLVAEAVGVRTGVPFGSYAYSGTLGLEVLGVPALVPLAWVMMAWPALVVARLLVGGDVVSTTPAGEGAVVSTTPPRPSGAARPAMGAGAARPAQGRRRWAVALVGAWALTAWDVFLDPQMVDLGHWTWRDPTPALPGVEGIPLTNFAGWLLVSLLMVGALDRLVPRRERRPAVGAAVPVVVYLWTYGSSVMAHALFFGRPPVALVGAVVMGLVAVPLAVRLLRAGRR